MAGARARWRATGMTDDDFGKPNIAIANSFPQHVPSQVDLTPMGQPAAGAVTTAAAQHKPRWYERFAPKRS